MSKELQQGEKNFIAGLQKRAQEKKKHNVQQEAKLIQDLGSAREAMTNLDLAVMAKTTLDKADLSSYEKLLSNVYSSLGALEAFYTTTKRQDKIEECVAIRTGIDSSFASTKDALAKAVNKNITSSKDVSKKSSDPLQSELKESIQKRQSADERKEASSEEEELCGVLEHNLQNIENFSKQSFKSASRDDVQKFLELLQSVLSSADTLEDFYINSRQGDKVAELSKYRGHILANMADTLDIVEEKAEGKVNSSMNNKKPIEQTQSNTKELSHGEKNFIAGLQKRSQEKKKLEEEKKVKADSDAKAKMDTDSSSKKISDSSNNNNNNEDEVKKIPVPKFKTAGNTSSDESKVSSSSTSLPNFSKQKMDFSKLFKNMDDDHNTLHQNESTNVNLSGNQNDHHDDAV